MEIIFKEMVVSDLIISENAINDEANPPSPLNIATIWGIEVIWTFLAKIKPIILPEKIPEAINIIDLANIDSCGFIATQDLGKLNEKGCFEVLGRFDNSEIRGCNLLVVWLLKSQINLNNKVVFFAFS